MGVSGYDIRDEHKQLKGDRLDFPSVANVVSLDIFKRVRKMSEVKVFFWFANAFGFSFTGLLGITWVVPLLKIDGIDLTGWKADLVFILLILFWVQKIAFGVAKNMQDMKNRGLSLKKKAHDVEKELED